ncbi:Myb- protein B [Tritrichomonas musculus]|uniref:Myb- protein B n=1 Tax=Tritrichomonas musculus TaxID=1915356 RepID=A0ABR2H824_9EUKA
MKSVSSSQAKKRMSIPLPQINYNSYKKAPTMFNKTEKEKIDEFSIPPNFDFNCDNSQYLDDVLILNQDGFTQEEQEIQITNNNDNDGSLEQTLNLNEKYIDESNQQTDQMNKILSVLNNILEENNIKPQKSNTNPTNLNEMLEFMANNNISINENSFKNEKNIFFQIKDESKNIMPSVKKSPKKFSDEEDTLLKNIVKCFGAKNWKFIAFLMPNKTSRQCRDRYMNYLAPGFIHTEWTIEEDTLLAQKFRELGPKWTKIQKYFPSRTANAIKNRYNYTIRKVLQRPHLLQNFNSQIDKSKGKCNYKNVPKLNKKEEKSEYDDIKFEIYHADINNTNIDNYNSYECFLGNIDVNENDLFLNYLNNN